MKHPVIQFSKALELVEKQTAKVYQKISVVRAEEFLQVRKTVLYVMGRFNGFAISCGIWSVD